MATDSSPFTFNAPALPSPAPSSPSSDPDETPGFYSLLLSAPEIASPELTALASLLLSRRIDRGVQLEMSTLIGELRDEWKVRVGAVKADWMARFIPDLERGEEEELKHPTIESDVEGREEMEERVHQVVEKEFVERVEEAERRVREALERTERMEVEVFVGGLLLEARDEVEDDAQVAEVVKAGLLDALEAGGYDVDSWKWEKEVLEETIEAQTADEVGEEGLAELKLA